MMLMSVEGMGRKRGRRGEGGGREGGEMEGGER